MVGVDATVSYNVNRSPSQRVWTSDGGSSWVAGLRSARWVLAIWILPYFLSALPMGFGRTVYLPVRVPEAAALGVAALFAILGGARGRASLRVAATAGLCVAATVGYGLFRETPEVGTDMSYFVQGALFSGTHVGTAVVAAIFFDADEFERLFKRIAVWSLLLALGAFISFKVFGSVYLVSIRQNGVGRLQGLLSEPSAWAPILGVLTIWAIRERSLWLGLLVATGVLAARSPTVLLVVVFSVSLFFLIFSRWTGTKPLVVFALVGLLAGGLGFAVSADPTPLTSSTNPIAQVIGRTVEGVQDVQSGGQLGRNARYVSTRVAFDELAQTGRFQLGHGPDAHAAYFAARNARLPVSEVATPNAIWVVVAFNFGIWGMIGLLGALVVALWRIRPEPQMGAILLPFTVASTINSATGPELFKWPVLLIMLYGLGWSRRVARRRRRPLYEPPVAVGRVSG